MSLVLRNNFWNQSLFLKISLEKRGRLIIRVMLYSGQYGSASSLLHRVVRVKVTWWSGPTSGFW